MDMHSSDVTTILPMNMPKLPIALIVAVAENGVIGIENRLPWHLPADLQYFKSRTLGKPIIMGRKTWESLRRPLPGRLNVVLTRQPAWEAEGAQATRSLTEALACAEAWATAQGVDELMVIGGSEIFQEALPLAQRLYLTRVALTPEGDAFFPEWQTGQWQCTWREAHPATAETPAHSYELWELSE